MDKLQLREEIKNKVYELNSLMNDETTTMDDSIIEINCNNIDYNVQDIFFGAPGTGKSYAVSELIKKCYPEIEEKDNPFVFRTTIYADYSYYNFIGSIMPTTEDEKITYTFTPGIFANALLTALKYKNHEVFLVVEEMSRGDIASIFGDIFQLLDRDVEGKSEYTINNEFLRSYFKENGLQLNKIFLPRNLHIIGTVNTSDQNVNVIDTAFKRRFGFRYVDVYPVKNNLGTGFLNEYKFTLDDVEYEWNRLYMALNRFIITKLELNEDKQIGQFFIKFDNLINDEQRFEAIQNKVLHYLWDDVQAAAISDVFNIFESKYVSFSEIYKSFGERKNIFSNKLDELYHEDSVIKSLFD